MKTIVLASITVLTSLFLALFVAELVIRSFWVPPSELSTPMLEEHPYYGWAPRPGIAGRHVSTEFDYEFSNTAQGFRGSDLFAASRPENIQNRILFLGDSFTWGNGSANDDIFVERVHARIPGTEVINSGANGYGQRQQLAIIDTLGAVLKPDLVVLMFFWNDLEDNIKNKSPSFSTGTNGRVVRTDLSVPDDFDPLAQRSAGKPRVRSSGNPLRKSYVYKLFKEGARDFRHRVFGGRERIVQTPEQRQKAWKVTVELLHQIKLRSDEIGSTLLIISIPDYERVSSEGRLKGQKPINFEIEDQFRQQCDASKLDCFDLLPGLKSRQAVASDPFYFPTDRHLTPEGNTAVADILTPILEDFLHQHHASTARP